MDRCVLSSKNGHDPSLDLCNGRAFCCPVWGCAGTTEINRLQKLQNRVARIVTKQ